nr:hypothetical protein [Tanacetum cinerariifolium]
MPSEAVEQGMDDHVPNEINGAKGEQVPNHVVNKGNFEFLVCKQVANHGGDEIVDKRLLKRKRVSLLPWGSILSLSGGNNHEILMGGLGSDNEYANEHIEKVLEIVDRFHIPNITQDQETLKEKFLSKYCPPARTAKKIEEINNFQQDPDETLYQVWERFKELLLRCPQHYSTDMQEVISFYKGLDVPTRRILDSKGAIPSMKAGDVKKVIQEMADHSKKWHNRTSIRCKSTKNSIRLAAIQA